MIKSIVTFIHSGCPRRCHSLKFPRWLLLFSWSSFFSAVYRLVWPVSVTNTPGAPGQPAPLPAIMEFSKDTGESETVMHIYSGNIWTLVGESTNNKSNYFATGILCMMTIFGRAAAMRSVSDRRREPAISTPVQSTACWQSSGPGPTAPPVPRNRQETHKSHTVAHAAANNLTFSFIGSSFK